MKIEICKYCEGTGTIKETDHYGKPEWSKCTHCEGTGRLGVIEWSHRLEIPYGNTEKTSAAYSLNSEVFKLFRALESQIKQMNTPNLENE